MVCFNIQDRQESDIHIANLKTDDQLLTWTIVSSSVMPKYWQRKEILFTPLGKKMIQKRALKFLEQFINCNGQLILPIK